MPDDLVVRTEHGAVRGAKADGWTAFLGLAYARAPAGDLRWQAPQPPTPWHGIADATAYGPACPQPPGFGQAPLGEVSEDCLRLNIFVPANSRAGLPVMVWVHGGGFVWGSAAEYLPEPLLRTGEVVVVTIGYRLGVLGFLAHPALEPAAGSGNLALLDIIAALRWISRNISGFRGDPARITLFGQSSGASLVGAALAAPLARGTFHRAIMQGATCAYPTPSLAQEEQRGLRLASELLSRPGDLPDVVSGPPPQVPADAPGSLAAGASRGKLEVELAEPRYRAAADPEPSRRQPVDSAELRRRKAELAVLRRIPAGELIAAATELGFTAWGPVHGGGVLPKSLPQAFAVGAISRVPVLQGTNRHDTRLEAALAVYLQRRLKTAESYVEMLTHEFGPSAAERILAEYPVAGHASPALAYAAATTDGLLACPGRAVATLLSRWTTVFSYEFDDPNAPRLVPIPRTFPMGAYHGAELPLLFGLRTSPAELAPGQQALSAQLAAYWTSFAAAGDPNGGGLAPWPSFDPVDQQIMSLSPDGCSPAAAFAEQHRCAFWDSLAWMPPRR